MGFLERAIRRGVSDAVGKAIGGAVKEAVAPTAEKYVNKAAQGINQMTNSVNQSMQQTGQPAGQTAGQSSLGGALANLQSSMEGYATQMSKNMKLCPACGEATTADKAFCPSCGAKLPEENVAQGAVCPSCGKQNTLGTKFCQDCGTKLPAAVAEEQATAEKNAVVLAQWEEKLPQYPKWEFGGADYELEVSDGYSNFSAHFESSFAAQEAVNKYRILVQGSGFIMAGEYPGVDHLYKMVGNTCYHIDTEHVFDAGSDTVNIYFNIDEPTGGFYYKKPEPKTQQGGFFDLFK